jgi:hypothetical protein
LNAFKSVHSTAFTEEALDTALVTVDREAKLLQVLGANRNPCSRNDYVIPIDIDLCCRLLKRQTQLRYYCSSADTPEDISFDRKA